MMHQAQMLPPLQWVMTSSWPSSPAKRYDGTRSFSEIVFLCCSVHKHFVSFPFLTFHFPVVQTSTWSDPLTVFFRIWMLKTKMRIPWTSWKDRRLCPAEFVRGITGPPAVHTRTHLVLCRRNWPSNWVSPQEKKRRQPVRNLHVVLLSTFWVPISFVFFKWILFSFNI